MEIMYVLLSIVASLLLCIAHWIYAWKNPKCNGKLPPGSMGLPIIGETLQFFIPYNTLNVQPFIRKRVERYGSVFRTSLIGHPVVISTDPEINRFIFQQEGKLVRSWYTESFDDIAGPENVLSVHGLLHKYLRNLILKLFGNESLKQGILLEIEELNRRHLKFWSTQSSVELKDATAMMVFNFSVGKLFSYNDSKSSRKWKQFYVAFLDGLISFPLYIPGTAYWKCLQGRNNALKMVKNLLGERRATPNRQQKDFLDIVVEEMDKGGNFLTEEMASDLLFALPFAAYETASSAITLAVKYLGEHPSVLDELTREHEAIIRGRKNTESGITWKEYKSMTFTHMVINETVRLANIVPGIFRKVIKDMEINGYTIPEGWIIMVCPTSVHLNPNKYNDPLNFNPWRWQDKELHSGSQNFMAFGGGVRLCVGAEFAKLQMGIFLHHLVTKYRWSVIKGGEVVRKPGLAFPNGFHIQILEKIVCDTTAN